ncbi:MAG: 1-deoxy-D-xylulose-5-phosphate synthase [Candidatus Aminicenantia bacterium]
MASIIEKIDSPSDLKKLSFEELLLLAQEIREEIIKVVSENGGHLSTNLGVVELTLALHLVFDAPKDKIIWDVGHQCYAHKLLTGRREKFTTLRKFEGLLGFPSREESEYDCYNTGHASTALSAALGMATARDLKEENFEVVAVVGDGSLTGGVAFEALNNIGYLKKKLIIVLNDNEMSISPNVGALSGYLNYLVSGQFFRKYQRIIEGAIRDIPAIGEKLFRLTRKIEEAVKKVLIPGALFEELGIKYIGPVRGHSIEMLFKALKDAKSYNGPVMVHVVTVKGKGYRPAMKEPDRFHSSHPFDIKTGEFVKKSNLPTYTSIFGKTIVELAEKDEKIIAITAAMSEGTGLLEFSKRFPNRFFDVGIAEQHAVLFASGLALEGLKPVVAIYSTFLQRAYDQLFHDVSLMKIPILFCLDRAGIVSGDGPTHQGIMDLAYLRPLPNVIIMAPKDEDELRKMIYTGLKTDLPTFVRYPKGEAKGVPLTEIGEIPIGKGEVLKEGSELAIIAIGSRVYPALRAGLKLEKEGISARVINARFVKPLDESLLLETANKFPFVFTVEEGIKEGGFGSAVREFLGVRFCQTKIISLGIEDGIVPVGDSKTLLKIYGLDEEGIYNSVIRHFVKAHEKRAFIK